MSKKWLERNDQEAIENMREYKTKINRATAHFTVNSKGVTHKLSLILILEMGRWESILNQINVLGLH